MNVLAAFTPQTIAPPRTEWRPLAAWATIVPEWRALAARALEPNVFYEPAFALPAATVFGRGLGAGLVWSHTNELIGFFPARIEHRCGLPVLSGWTHPYGPLGTPLVDPDHVEPAIVAWLNHVADDPALPDLMLLRLTPEDGAFSAALSSALARRRMASALFGQHRRALLVPGPERTHYLEHAVGAKKRKELRRQRHRLADIGTLKIDATASASCVGDALNDFLKLEARGWKGRAGTAALNDEPIRHFIETALEGLAADHKVRIDRLRVSGTAVAAIVTLRSGNTAWTWKIAYDEAYGRTSPGVQLMLDVSEALLADATIGTIDSCATADHPMIDHLWRERLSLCDRLIAVRPAPLAFAAACWMERVSRSAISFAKTVRDRLAP
jgi:CelD/BcsL family acetyltransferase involved in cellulose biosynthesis